MITPRSFFIDEHVIKRVDSFSLRPTVETRKAKKARESCVGSVVGASSSATTKDSQSSKMQNLE